MDELKNCIIALLGLSIGVCTTIIVMIHGWGLEPKSWFYIFGVYYTGHFIAYLLHRLSKD
jgi:hypothetical protein